MSKQYLLMAVDKRYNNEAYLYNTAKIVNQVGSTAIIEVEAENVDFIARYQLGRLQSGWNVARCNNPILSYDEALSQALTYEANS